MTQYINSKTKTTNTYYNFNFILNSFCYIFHNKTNSTFIDWKSATYHFNVCCNFIYTGAAAIYETPQIWI